MLFVLAGGNFSLRLTFIQMTEMSNVVLRQALSAGMSGSSGVAAMRPWV